MTRWDDPLKLCLDVETSRRWHARHTKDLPSMVQRYHGPTWAGGSGDVQDPENRAFEWLSLMLGQAIASNPRALVSELDEVGDENLRDLQLALNDWLVSTNPRPMYQRLFVDFAMMYGVTMVTNGPPVGMVETEDSPFLPAITQLPLDRCGWDSQCLVFEQARFTYTIDLVDRDVLLQRAEDHPEEEWDVQAIKELIEAREIEALRRPNAKDSPERNEIAYYTAHISEQGLKPDELAHFDPKLFNGRVHTLPLRGAQKTSRQTPKPLRRDRPFFGPRGGGMVLSGCYTVPGSSIPLAPLCAVDLLVRELNAYARATQESSSRQKTIGMVDGVNAEDAQKIVDAEDGEVILVKGLSKEKYVELSTQGISEQRLLIESRLRDQIARALGMYAAAAGEVEGVGSATEQAWAQTSNAARNGFIVQRFQDARQQELQKVAWYLRNEPRVPFKLRDGSIHLPRLSPETLTFAVKRKLLSEGMAEQLTRLAQQERDDELHSAIQIEPYSMQRTSEALQQARLMQGAEAVAMAVPLIPQSAEFFDWQTWFQKLGDALNWPNMGRIVDKQGMQKAAAVDLAGKVADIASTAQQGKQAKPAPTSRPTKPSGGGSSKPKEQTRPTYPGNVSGARAGAAAKRKAG